MAIAARKQFTDNLVDLKSGQISREIFVSEEIYQMEQEQVFTRSWLFIGHESQIAKPGDYFISSMGEESVILCRDRENKIHAFLNSCRHRGMKVCRYDEVNTPVFPCPYHGWSYATDGRLVLQRRFLKLVSFGAEIASRNARPQSCQPTRLTAMKRCSRPLFGNPSYSATSEKSR